MTTRRTTTATTRRATSRIPSEGPTSEQQGVVQDEQAAGYRAGTTQEQKEQTILDRAEAILRQRYERQGTIGQPTDAADWLRVRLGTRTSEAFCVIFLDNRHRVLGFSEMFHGTIDGASVSPREVVRACLQHNAAAVILAHNHPSGVSEPSAADVALTHTLRQALDLIGTRILDHLVIGQTVTSLRTRGLC